MATNTIGCVFTHRRTERPIPPWIGSVGVSGFHLNKNRQTVGGGLAVEKVPRNGVSEQEAQ